MGKKEVNNKKNQNRPYQKDAAELRKWLHESRRWSTIKEFADFFSVQI